jgi:hypothetical protein
MRRLSLLTASIALLLPFMVLTASASAVNIFQVCTSSGQPADISSQAAGTDVCKDAAQQKASGTNPIITVLKVVLSIISFVAGIAVVITVILSGIRFITSGGDSNGIKKARETLIYSVVGIVVVIFAQVIVVFILDRITS